MSNEHLYIRDVNSWSEIELTYSSNLDEINLQLLFYNLKISSVWFKDSLYTTYKLQSL